MAEDLLNDFLPRCWMHGGVLVEVTPHVEMLIGDTEEYTMDLDDYEFVEPYQATREDVPLAWRVSSGFYFVAFATPDLEIKVDWGREPTAGFHHANNAMASFCSRQRHEVLALAEDAIAEVAHASVLARAPEMFSQRSLEAEKARATAINLITAWLGAEAIPPGEEHTKFLADNFWAKVLAMDSDETAHLIYGLTLVGAFLARPASRLPDALNLLNELEVDTEAFIAEHPGDPFAYLSLTETIIEMFLRREPLDDEDDQEPLS